MGIAIGIDLGTTNSCVAVVQGGRARVIEDRAARRVHPSIVSFLPNGETVACHKARDRQIDDPENTIHSAKRLIGRDFRSNEMQQLIRELPYDVAAGPDNIPVVRVRSKEVSLPEVSAILLQHLRRMCTQTLDVDISEAVITVPANFDDVQRSSTKVAGRIAGFNVLRILNEPTAAALAYGFGANKRERVAVYDFGGGTFDITIVELADDIFEVLSTAGDTYLGGDDFDGVIVDEMLREFKKLHKIDLSEKPATLQRIRSVAERVKCQLSSLDKVQANLKNIAKNAKGIPLDFSFQIERKRFNQLISPFVEKSLAVSDEALRLAGILKSDLDNLVMVGGTTRTPLVRTMVAEHFGIVPRTEINPDEVVAIGAAIQAFSLTGEQLPAKLPQPPAEQPIKRRTMIGSHPGKAPFSAPPRPATIPSPTAPERRQPLPGRSSTPNIPSTVNEERMDLDLKRPPAADDNDLGVDIKRDAASATDQTLGIDVKKPLHEKIPPAPAPRRRDIPNAVELGVDVKRPSDTRNTAARRRSNSPDAVEFGVDVKRPSQTETSSVSKRQALPDVFDLGIDVKRPSDDDLLLDIKKDAVQDRNLAIDIKRYDSDMELDILKETTPHSLELDVKHDLELGIDLKRPSDADLEIDIKQGAPLDTALSLDVFATSPEPHIGPPASDPPLEIKDIDITEIDPRTSSPATPAQAQRMPSVAGVGAPPPSTASYPSRRFSEPSIPRELDEVAAAPGTAIPSRDPNAEGAIPSSVSVPDVKLSQSALLLDVTPRALGVAVAGGFCDIIIERNAAIPVEQSRRFTTSTDNQTEVSIDIYQGESRRVGDNTKLGQVVLTHIRPAIRGAIKIRVTFEIDTDGILGVRAVNEETKEAQSTRIVLSGGMDEAKVQALVEKYAR